MTREEGRHLVRLITAACTAASRAGAHPEDAALWEADREAFSAALAAVFALEGVGSTDTPGPTGEVPQLAGRTGADGKGVSWADTPKGLRSPQPPGGPRSARTPAERPGAGVRKFRTPAPVAVTS